MGREKLAQHLLRSPFSQQKMRYLPKTQAVLYRSKMNPILKRNFEVFPVLDWIAALTAHIPNQGEHLVRYYGWYRDVSRGKRKKAQEHGRGQGPDGIVEVPPPPPSSGGATQGWAHDIRQVDPVDSLLTPPCGGSMRIIAFIDQALNVCVFQGASNRGRNITRTGIPRGLLGILRWRGTW